MNTVFNRRTVLMAAALGASTTLLQACGAETTNPSATSSSWHKTPPS